MNPSLDHLNDEDQVTYFGETDARNRRLRFGIKRKDRAKHLYAIGKTGMGKSTLLENLAVQDILNGEGLCFLDPHGKSADLLLEYVPEHRIKDVIYFAPFDMEHPISFNVMEDVGPEQRYLVASGMMSAFKKIWVDAWSARMEYILGNIMLALLEYPGSTLVGVNRMLTDKDFRKEVVSHISDPSVKSFWVNEYANYTEKFAAEAAPAIQNKVGQFIANPLIRNIIGQPKSSFDIRDVMDNRKILIINLSKGRVGEANANLLGSMLITKIYLGAMSRADLNEKQLEKAPNFYLYVDEFQSFANESFADILSEARKYKLSLCIAHQYIEQMTEEVRAAVFGNVGTMVTFRVGAYDAEILEKEYAPHFLAEDIVALQKYQMYLKLMIDGVTSPPFSAAGMSPIPRPQINYTNDILASSRQLYAKPRQQVEEELLAWIQKKFGGGGGSSSGGSGGASSSGGGSSGHGASGASKGGQKSGSGGYSGESRSAGGTRSGSGNSIGTSPVGDNRGYSSSRAPQGYEGRGNSGSGSGGVNRGGSAHSAASSSMPASNARNGQNNQGSSQQSGGANSSMRPIESQNREVVSRQQNYSPTSSTVPTQTSQNQQASTNTRPQSPAINQNNASAPTDSHGNEREQELRKAMSLSYLKTEAPAPKHEKVPKPENVAALREALLSVMKTEGITAQQTPSASAVSGQGERDTQDVQVDRNGTQPQPQTQISNHHQSKHHTTHSAATAVDSSKDIEHKTSHKSHDSGVKHNGKHHSATTHTPSSDGTAPHKDKESAKVTKEVEGDVLKNIFED